MPNVNLLVVQQHAVYGLDGGFRGLGGLVVHIAVATGATVLVSGNLAGQNVAKSGEGIVKGLEDEN